VVFERSAPNPASPDISNKTLNCSWYGWPACMLGIGDTLLSRCLKGMSYFRYGCSYVPHQVVVVVVVVVVVPLLLLSRVSLVCVVTGLRVGRPRNRGSVLRRDA